MKRKNEVFVGRISDIWENVITMYNEKARKVVAVQLDNTTCANCTPCLDLLVRCEYFLERKTGRLVAAHLNEVIMGISSNSIEN